MRKIILILCAVSLLSAETLFEVKDSANNKVLDVSTDGIAVMNLGDTLMVISTTEIKAVIDDSKVLSRKFSVSTTSAKKGQYTDLFDVSLGSATMREAAGQRYTDFSPENIFIGLNSGISTTPGVPDWYYGITNILIGNESGRKNTTGGNNIMLGDHSGYNNTTGGSNIYIGNNSGEINTGGSFNLFIGNGSGKNNTATNNMFMGHNAGYTNVSGSSNLFVGADAGAYNNSGSKNVFIGQSVGVYNTSASNNTLLGWGAGSSNNSPDNTFIGYTTGSTHTSGDKNTFIGALAGQSNSTGSYNTFMGYAAGQNSGTTSTCTYVGYYSGYSATGYGNTFMGWGSGRITTGDYNVMLGHGSGNLTTSGNYNVFLGTGSGHSNVSGSGNVFLGNDSGYNETGSNKLYIDNSDTATPLIHGDFGTDFLTVNGTLKVKTLEIADMGSSNLGLDGDIVPYLGSTSGYDLGNNVVNEYWDDVVATDFITYSDKNAKDEIKTINHGLQDLLKLRPVSYRYKKDISPDNRLRLGLIAQEVEEVIPEAVVNDDIDFDPETGEKIVTKGQYKAMNYDQLIPVLIKAVQEQHLIIEEMKKEIELLKKN
jgi:hypothetical protein